MLKEFQLYIDDIDAMSKSSLNQDQKDLIKRILKNTYEHNKEDFDNVFQLLKSRVSLGFVFDAAPSVDNTQVALLSKDNELSFENTKSIGGGN